jgi:hypothetical protein
VPSLNHVGGTDSHVPCEKRSITQS